MAIFDTTAYASALKIKYGPRLVSQVNDKITALKLFSDSRDEWEGLRVEYPVLIGRGQSFMAHGSLGLLPTPQNETTLSVQIPVKWVRGRIQFEIAVMKASLRSSGAFARANDTLMNRLITNLSDELNRMLSSGSGTGVLALVDGATTGTTITVDAPAGIANDLFGSRYLQPNMVVAFANTTTINGIRTLGAVTSETGATPGFTIDTAFSTTDNDNIVRAANTTVTNLTNDTSYNNEPMGLEGIVDDGTLVTTFHNISRTTYPDWQATRLSVSGLSLDALQRLMDTIDQQSGQMPTDFMVHHSVRRAYLALVDTARTFMQTGQGPGKFDLGQEPSGLDLSYNGYPIHTDKDIMLGEWLAVNKEHLIRYVLVEGEWAEETGSMFRAVSGQDALEAIYRVGVNYGTDQCNSHGKLVGMSQTNAIARHVV